MENNLIQKKITAQKEDIMRNHAAQKRALNEGFSSAIESAVWLWCIEMLQKCFQLVKVLTSTI